MKLSKVKVHCPAFDAEAGRVGFEAAGALLAKLGITGDAATMLWNNQNILVAAGLRSGELWKDSTELTAREVVLPEFGEEGVATIRDYNTVFVEEMGGEPEDVKNLLMAMAVFYSFVVMDSGKMPPLFPEIGSTVDAFGGTLVSESTRKSYCGVVRDFLCSVDETKPFDEADENDREQYLAGLREKRSESSYRQARAALSAYFRWQVKRAA